jgi:hypothetical protein
MQQTKYSHARLMLNFMRLKRQKPSNMVSLLYFYWHVHHRMLNKKDDFSLL